VAFHPVKKQSIADEITEQILKMIFKGEVRPGERLPPERELAVSFKTNRNTLREAIRNLQTMNVVVARQGDGLIVRDFWSEGELNLLPYFVREIDDPKLQWVTVRDMLRLRSVLLEEVVWTVATENRPGVFDGLEQLVKLQRSQLGEPEKMIRTDFEFAMSMVESLERPAYRWVFNSMARLYKDVVFHFPMFWIFADDYVDSLEKIVSLLRSGDAEGSRRQMREHLEKADRLVLGALTRVRELLE